MIQNDQDARDLKGIASALYQAHEFERQAALDEWNYHHERRDALMMRIRTGCVALNAASLVALMSITSASGNLTWFGLQQRSALVSACAFAIGLLAGGLSLILEHRLAVDETSDAYAKAVKLNVLVSRYSRPATEESFKDVESMMKDSQTVPLTGFRYSNAAILMENVSASAWAVGLLYPLATVLLHQI